MTLPFPKGHEAETFLRTWGSSGGCAPLGGLRSYPRELGTDGHTGGEGALWPGLPPLSVRSPRLPPALPTPFCRRVGEGIPGPSQAAVVFFSPRGSTAPDAAERQAQPGARDSLPPLRRSPEPRGPVLHRGCSPVCERPTTERRLTQCQVVAVAWESPVVPRCHRRFPSQSRRSSGRAEPEHPRGTGFPLHFGCEENSSRAGRKPRPRAVGHRAVTRVPGDTARGEPLAFLPRKQR